MVAVAGLFRRRRSFRPLHVKRGAWRRDGGQFGFVAHDGQRCGERTFLEFHHIHPYARQGPTTVENISLRCRRHNQYEAELVFGPYGMSAVREEEISAILQQPVRQTAASHALSP